MKEFVRVLGIDDGPFKFSDKTVPIVGVLMRQGYIDCVMSSKVKVDGDDSTRTVIGLVNGSKYKKQVKAIMIDGIAFGGFNVVDLDAVHEATGVPIMSVTRDPPDFKAMRSVLRSRFDDWERRWDIISTGELLVVETKHNPVHVKPVGMAPMDVKDIITRSIVRGALPEPLRVAHLIATALVKGESKGNA